MLQIFLLCVLFTTLHAQEVFKERADFNPLWKKSEQTKFEVESDGLLDKQIGSKLETQAIDFGAFGHRSNDNSSDVDPLDEFLRINSDNDSAENSPFVFGKDFKQKTPRTESRQKLRGLLDEFLISQRKLDYGSLVTLPKPARIDEIKEFLLIRLDYYRYDPDIEEINEVKWKINLPAWVNLPFLGRKLQRQSFKNHTFTWTHRSLQSSQIMSGSLMVNDDTKLQLVFKKPQPRARVSIVIDDMGHMSRGFKVYREMGHPLTMAFLPFYDTTAMQSELAHREGFEIMLHMPMQPNHRRYFRSPLVIETDLDPQEVRSRVRKSLLAVPLAEGFNNHQGSKATKDLDLMRIVMDEVSQHRKLYFIDSITTGSSKAYQAATEAGFSATKRNSDFLDNIKTHKAVTTKLEELINLSLRSKGVRLAIIHESKISAKAVKQVLPKLESLNIEVVSPSDFIEPNLL